MPDRTLMEWIRGKRLRDIELPNESGMVDPNLPPLTPEQQMEMFRNVNKQASGMDPLTGLKRAIP